MTIHIRRLGGAIVSAAAVTALLGGCGLFEGGVDCAAVRDEMQTVVNDLHSEPDEFESSVESLRAEAEDINDDDLQQLVDDFADLAESFNAEVNDEDDETAEQADLSDLNTQVDAFNDTCSEG